MNLRTYPEIWKAMTAEQKQQLCEVSGVGYDYMRNLVNRRSCGKYVAKVIAEALHELGYLECERADAFNFLFSDTEPQPKELAT